MKASIGGSFLLYIVVFIVSIAMLLLVGLLSYSKAYKVKNRIINVIETNLSINEKNINSDLASVGYNVNNKRDCTRTNTFKKLNGMGKIKVKNVSPKGGYDYCIYKCTLNSNSEYYYVVVTFTTFNLPLVGAITPIEVSGETKILGKKYNY